ncbi:MAG TPA: right-handed parallel beta-helix repeat-containing protein [Candidatus Obscuribacterales bacterium]
MTDRPYRFEAADLSENGGPTKFQLDAYPRKFTPSGAIRNAPEPASENFKPSPLKMDNNERTWESTEPFRVLAPKEVYVRAGESIQRAIDGAPEGATIFVGEGIYKERLNISRDNITLKANGRAVFDMSGRFVSGPVIDIQNRKNITIDGFEIRNVRGGPDPMAIRVNGASSSIKIINNDIHHVESKSNAFGIGVFGTHRTPLTNIVIANNKIHDLKLGQSESLVINGNVDGFKIVGNAIHDNDNIGIDIIGGEGIGRAGIDQARNGVITRNHIANIDSGKNPAYRERCAAGIYLDGARDVLVQDNVVINSNYGIELASERRGWHTEGITVKHNRLERNHLAGISLGGGTPDNGGVKDSLIEDNQLIGNSRAVWQQDHVSGVLIRSNRIN